MEKNTKILVGLAGVLALSGIVFLIIVRKKNKQEEHIKRVIAYEDKYCQPYYSNQPFYSNDYRVKNGIDLPAFFNAIRNGELLLPEVCG